MHHHGKTNKQTNKRKTLQPGKTVKLDMRGMICCYDVIRFRNILNKKMGIQEHRRSIMQI